MRKVKKNFIYCLVTFILLMLPAVIFADFNIALIKDSNLTQFNEVAQGFASTILQKPNYTVKEFDIDGSVEKGQEYAEQINSGNYHLVFTIGERSSFVAAQFINDLPVVFTMVLNYRDPRFNLINNPRVAGISNQVPVENTFFFLQMLVPDAKTVGIVYSERSSEIVDSIKERQDNLGVKIVVNQVRNERQVRRAFNRLKRENFDVYFMVTDPIVYTADNTIALIEECKNDGIPFIAYSDAFVQRGAFMAVSPSYPTIGSQAASITEGILEYGDSPQNVGVVAPIGTFSVVNDITRAALGLEISDAIYNFIDQVYRADE